MWTEFLGATGGPPVCGGSNVGSQKKRLRYIHIFTAIVAAIRTQVFDCIMPMAEPIRAMPLTRTLTTSRMGSNSFVGRSGWGVPPVSGFACSKPTLWLPPGSPIFHPPVGAPPCGGCWPSGPIPTRDRRLSNQIPSLRPDISDRILKPISQFFTLTRFTWREPLARPGSLATWACQMRAHSLGFRQSRGRWQQLAVEQAAA